MAKVRRTIDKSYSQEEDLHSVFIVVFKGDTTPKRIRQIVAAQGCKLQQGSDGRMPLNVVCVPEGKTDIQCIQKFSRLPEVKSAKQNEWEVTL